MNEHDPIVLHDPVAGPITDSQLTYIVQRVRTYQGTLQMRWEEYLKTHPDADRASFYAGAGATINSINSTSEKGFILAALEAEIGMFNNRRIVE